MSKWFRIGSDAHFAGFSGINYRCLITGAKAYASLLGAETAGIEREINAYVSYRIRNKVFWSAKTVKIPRGAALVTDGRDYACALWKQNLGFALNSWV
jgi:hypothetical protein